MYVITDDDFDFQAEILNYLKSNGNYPKNTDMIMEELDTDDVERTLANLIFLEFSNVILRTAFWYVNVSPMDTFWCINGADLRN